MVEPNFLWYDYVLFVLMLLTSAFIGLYFGYIDRKGKGAQEYLLGGKSMKSLPISLSLVTSILSAVVMTAYPAEVYRFGAQSGLLVFLMCGILVFLYLGVIPVLYNLNLTSIYEYIELRFNKRIRKLTSFLYAFYMLTLLPVILYIPCIVLAQATGYNVHYITVLVSAVCVFYTTVGGLKAVVWTDSLQFFVMLFSGVITVYIGTTSQGFANVFQTAHQGGRLDIDFDVDPTKRKTFWSIFFGFTAYWMNHVGINQSCVQKCFALPSLNHIKWSLIYFGLGFTAIFSLNVYIGLMMYAEFKDCDPFISKQIEFQDQIVFHYILLISSKAPGLAGLFIAGIFSASLSSLSSGINALSCTIYKDFMSSRAKSETSSAKVDRTLKSLAALVGVATTLLVFLVQRIGNAFSIIVGVAAIPAGPMFGLFLLGMFCTRATSKAAMFGVTGAIAITGWIVIGSQYYSFNHLIVEETKPLGTAGCHVLTNLTTIFENSTKINEFDDGWQPWSIYRISFYYYTIIGVILVLVIAVPMSYLSKKDVVEVDKRLISPLMHWSMEKPSEKDKIVQEMLAVNGHGKAENVGETM